MDTTITIIILVALAIISIIGGIICLIKYIKNKGKFMLALGIIFTFIVPAILIFIALKIWYFDSMVIYGPAPMMAYGPAPVR